MADVQILRSTSGAVPGVYRLPDNAEFILKCVRATFDGSGAAGTYLPLTAELERRATEQWPGFAEFLGREDTG